MSLATLSQARSKLPYLFVLTLLSLGCFNYFFITKPIAIFFEISSLTGQALVNEFISLCNCTYEIVKLAYLFSQILCEDSLIFLKDAIHLIKGICRFLEDFSWHLGMTAFQILRSFSSILGFIQNTIRLWKERFFLAGSTIWHFFISTPGIVVSYVKGIYALLKNFINEILIFIIKLQEQVFESSKNILLFDVPLDSVYGLIIGAVLLTILCVKFRVIFCVISSIFLKLYQQVTSLGYSLWSGRFLEQNRKNVHYSAEDDERLCIVCQSELKEIIIFPCKHLCLCRDCSKKLTKGQPACPICRCNITGTLKVYV